MRAIHELFLYIDSSAANVGPLLSNLYVRAWPVVRAPLELLARSGWNPNCESVRTYVRERSSFYVHTLFAENTFNYLHDKEQRGATHTHRGTHSMTAFALSNMQTRAPELSYADVDANDKHFHDGPVQCRGLPPRAPPHACIPPLRSVDDDHGR